MSNFWRARKSRPIPMFLSIRGMAWIMAILAGVAFWYEIGRELAHFL